MKDKEGLIYAFYLVGVVDTDFIEKNMHLVSYIY